MEASPPTTRRVLIAAAMWEELLPVVSTLRFQLQGDRWTLQRGETTWTATHFGLGEPGVNGRLRSVIEAEQPDRVIVIGFAGALSPELAIGDLQRIDVVRCVESSAFYALSANDPPVLLDDGDADGSVGAASVLTVAEAAGDRATKAALWKANGAMLVDMESSFAAALCLERQLPLHIWRAVSDTAHETVPSILINCVQPDGTVDLKRAMRSLAIRPWLWRCALRLRRNAKRAGAALIDAVREELATDEAGIQSRTP